MRRQLLAAAMSLLAVSVSTAEINEWTAQDQGQDWDLDGTNGIRILNSGIFKFESVTSGNLDEIGSIVIDDSVTGTVTVFIERSTDNNTPGATNVGFIDLTNDHATPVIGNLQELRITGDLGTAGPIVVANVTEPPLRLSSATTS